MTKSKGHFDYADRFDQLLRERGFSGYGREYRFAAEAVGGTGKGLRKRLALAGLKDWRFDFAFVSDRIAVEIDGGGRLAVINPRTGRPLAVGRHAQADDYDKLNRAQRLGWFVLRYTPEMMGSEKWIDDLRDLLGR